MITFPFRLTYTVWQCCWVLTNGVGNLVLERLRSALPILALLDSYLRTP